MVTDSEETHGLAKTAAALGITEAATRQLIAEGGPMYLLQVARGRVPNLRALDAAAAATPAESGTP